jgi:serine/threonine-protein kinase
MAQPQPQQSRVDKDTFLQRVRASGLISPERLEKALGQMPPTERAKPVARGLIEQGLLTKFQAQRLLGGKTDGFLLGQYRILDELGRGGMGHVFKAEHMTMGRLVALKILNSNLLKTERARQLFHREVKAAARLSHPNIVTAFDANQVGDRCFLVMEYVDGPNLHDLVKDHGPLPVTQACDYIRQAALGLQYAHDIGMVHRDIKPANLLVQKSTSKAGINSSVVKILDFGLARISSPEDGGQEHDSIETNARTVMGTPDYLSPEQARCLHGVDGRADLYSLGCTMHTLLVGQVPYPGGTAMEKLVRHSTEHPQPVNVLRPDVPVEVAVIVQKMMAKKPEDRYQSGAELAAVLLPYTGQETTGWVAVEPLPAEPIMPVSSRSLPRIERVDNDPFANIDDAAEEQEPGAAPEMVGTLSGEGAITDLSSSAPSGPYRQRKKKKNDSGLLWVMVLLLVVISVFAGLFLVLRPIIQKALDGQ